MKNLLITAVLLLIALAVDAKIVMPGVFTDNMIVQQQSVLNLHGTATQMSSVEVNVGWMKKPLLTKADEQGRWSISVGTPKASRRAYQIVVSDGEAFTIDNVLVGEVWFCSGQSNMEMPLAGWGKVKDYEKEIAAAQYPYIRIYQVRQTTAFAPQTVVPQGYTQGWQEVKPETIGKFSSLAYFYARELWQKMGIPVGVINSSWGGTPAEAWISHDALKSVQGFQQRLEKIEQTGFASEDIYNMYRQEQEAWRALAAKADKGLSQHWESADADDNQWSVMTLPGYWEQKGLKDFDGVVWYRRHVTLSAEEAKHDLQLNFGCIDDEDVVYWNGKEVAQGAGYNQPRHYTIPAAMLKEGDNVVAVRVNDTGGEGGIGGVAEDMNINGTRTIAGEWRYAIGCDARQLPPVPTAPGSSWFPSTLYNAMVYPFRDFPIKGVIWYQGCANVGRAVQYDALMKTLVSDWRRCFDNATMPFHFVQLANYLQHQDLQPQSEWAALRDAQRKTTNVEGVEMMVNIDLGEANDIHPKNKQEVGRRLAALTLAKTYGKLKYGKAPEYQGYKIEDRKVVIGFAHDAITAPLEADADIKGFAVQSPDGRWHVATAKTAGAYAVEVAAAGVDVPVAVSYGWADNPVCTLKTAEGFHVGPFMTR